MEQGRFHFTDKNRVVAVGKLANNLALHSPEAILENWQTERTQFIGCCLEASTNSGLRLEENRSQVFLIAGEHVERKTTCALNHSVAGAVGFHGHHHERWFK